MFFLVSHKYKFLMGWSAKCGCSAVKRWYMDTHGVDRTNLGIPLYKLVGYGKTEYTSVNWDQPRLYNEYRKYAVVRNPYSRVVSGFVNKYVIGNKLPNRGWDSFSEFLEILSQDTEFKTVDTHHFTHQFSENYRGFNRAGFEFDRVIQLENLAAGLKSVSTYHGMDDVQVMAANKTEYGQPGQSTSNAANTRICDFDKKNIPPFQYFYNRSTTDLVRNIYALDFEHLEALDIFYQAPSI
ncbi:MAG: hypothetical protein DRQ56_04375 [Gammaproteobacteria bacterium]|nr:MAG: hypothetical protein DRQ56_04375 [Gammaproteobacteria bacterium]